MTFHAADPEYAEIENVAAARSRRFWKSVGGSPYALPTPEPASGRDSSDPALSTSAPRLRLVRIAREIDLHHGSSMAGSSAVKGASSRPRVLDPGPFGYSVGLVSVGSWGPRFWVVTDTAIRQEVARYPAAEVDGPGALLQFLQEQQCWRERQRKERVG